MQDKTAPDQSSGVHFTPFGAFQNELRGAQPMACGTEAEVCVDIAQRQSFGLAKYGTQVKHNPLNLEQWLRHAYEENLDAAIYLKRAMDEINRSPDVQATKVNQQLVESLNHALKVMIELEYLVNAKPEITLKQGFWHELEDLPMLRDELSGLLKSTQLLDPVIEQMDIDLEDSYNKDED